LDWAVTNFRSLNILIHNAGIQKEIDFKKGTADLLSGENEIEINLQAPIHLSALFIPHLTKQKEAAIVNTLSPGDKVLAVSIGVFGDRFTSIARQFGAEVTPLTFEWGRAADVDRLIEKMTLPAHDQPRRCLIDSRPLTKFRAL
jgi:hypothetical protein